MYIKHHGVKGMKWGVRRYQNKDGSLTAEGRKKYVDTIGDTKTYTKNGVEVTLRKQPVSIIAKTLSKVSPSIRDNIERADFIDIKVEGKKVGDLQLYKESPKSLNVVWLGIESEHGGQGYGQAVMRAVVDHAKKQNLDTVTLEVPGISPNARHIYESLGFKSKGLITDEDDNWGGLTAMELNLRE